MTSVLRGSGMRRGLCFTLALCAGVTTPLRAQEHGPPPMPFDRWPERDFGDRAIHDLPDRADTLATLIDRLALAEAPERDAHGFPVRRGRIAAAGLSAAGLAQVLAAGYQVIGQTALPALDQTITELTVPKGMSARDAAKAVATLDPAATVDVVHYYGLEPAGGKPKPLRERPDEPLPYVENPVPAVIGMIDTAIMAHPRLAALHILPWPQGDHRGGPVSHGTAIASIIAQGSAPTIYAANIFRGPPDRPFTSADVVAQALEWLVAHHVPVINMSLAGPRNALLDRLIEQAVAHGTMIVAAAGNGGPTAPPAYPAAVPGVIAVTAVDRDLHVYRFANRGPYVAFAASGVDVIAANTPVGVARFTGTSFATAHVTAVLARCRADGHNAGQCIDRLIRSARDLGVPGRDPVYGYGFIE